MHYFDDSWKLIPSFQPFRTTGYSHDTSVGLKVYVGIVQQYYHGPCVVGVRLWEGHLKIDEVTFPSKMPMDNDPFLYVYHYKPIFRNKIIFISISQKPS